MKRISVQGLNKKYRLGRKDSKAETLVESFLSYLQYPVKNFARLRNLSNFSSQNDQSIFYALNGIDFSINEGEVVGIIGRNGAGKSTLLKILSRITEPSSGKVEISGRIASLLEVGTGFHPELTGRENIYMNGTILGMSRKEIVTKMDEIIDFSGVEKFVDTPVKFYSSGMKVRLGFSVAAHLDPDILIVDEVLAVGDYEFQKKCLGKMEEVNKYQGRTILFVSHQLSLISSLCSRTIVLDKGCVSFDGRTDKALSHYLSFTKPASSLDGLNDFLIDGNKNILLRSISVFSKTGVISSFQQFCIFLDFEIYKGVDISKARVDIRIDDVLGNHLIWLTSKINPELNFYKSRIEFIIENLPLIPGEYFLTIYFHDGISVASHYESAFSFFVTDSPYYGSEIKVPNNQGSIILKYFVN